MNAGIKKRILKVADTVVGIFYPRYNPQDCNWDSIKEIIIVRPDRIGDVVLTLPVLRELKKKRPDINLTMIVSSYTKELLEESKIVDSVVILEQNMKFWNWLRFIKLLRRVRYDMAVDMVFSRKILSGFITFLTCAKIKLGFDAGLKRFFFNCLLSPQENDKYEVERNFELMRYLTGSDVDVSLDSNCIIPDLNYVKEFLNLGMVKAGERLHIAIHPGAYRNIANRLWPKERYAELADRLIEKYNSTVFFTGSKSKEDRQLLKSIEDIMINKAIFIKGEISIRQLYALFQFLNVFIGTFTGPLHLAASAGVSTIVLGGPTPPERWMPIGKRHILIQAKVSCVPCRDNTICFRKDYACMKNIRVDEVLAAVDRIVTEAGEF